MVKIFGIDPISYIDVFECLFFKIASLSDLLAQMTLSEFFKATDFEFILLRVGLFFKFNRQGRLGSFLFFNLGKLVENFLFRENLEPFLVLIGFFMRFLFFVVSDIEVFRGFELHFRVIIEYFLFKIETFG